MPSMFRKPSEVDDTSTDHTSEGGSDSGNGERSKDQTVAQLSSLSNPVLEPFQHFIVHYMSYIEKECRETAVKEINLKRSAKDQLPEDHPEVNRLSGEMYKNVTAEMQKSGVPLGDFSGQRGAQLRENYSKTFGAALANATKTALGSVQDSDHTGASLLPFSPLRIAESSHDVLLRVSNDKPSPVKSIYAAEYIELGLLGKGGFGKVFRCLNLLDSQEYAIKQIVINPSKMEKLHRQGNLEALLLEIKTFAGLHHHNLVRYFHSWIEPLENEDSGRKGETQGLLDNREYYDSSYAASNDSHLIVSVAGASRELSNNFSKSKEYSDQDSNIRFEESSAQEESLESKSRQIQSPSQGTAASYRPSVRDACDDDDIEEVLDFEKPITSFQIGEISWIAANRSFKSGVVLFIKMSMHQLTLSNYLSPDYNQNLPQGHRWCYHTTPAAKLCLAILDGVDYLHGQNIVHRDLKPANILLSIDESKARCHSGSVDISGCEQCGSNKNSEPVYITPCISDFGLTAKLDDPDAIKELGQPIKTENVPVGTKAYRPLDIPTEEPITCPKLDIYSLGVITFELIAKFTTEFERRTVLENLAHGLFPDGFEKHEMAEGIKNMLYRNRNRRWDSNRVRSWLKDILEKGGSEADKNDSP